jgi:hypothetical protein
MELTETFSRLTDTAGTTHINPISCILSALVGRRVPFLSFFYIGKTMNAYAGYSQRNSEVPVEARCSGLLFLYR